jgi:hypothetical protein
MRGHDNRTHIMPRAVIKRRYVEPPRKRPLMVVPERRSDHAGNRFGHALFALIFVYAHLQNICVSFSECVVYLCPSASSAVARLVFVPPKPIPKRPYCPFRSKSKPSTD